MQVFLWMLLHHEPHTHQEPASQGSSDIFEAIVAKATRPCQLVDRNPSFASPWCCFFDGIGREPIELRMFVHHLPIEGKTPHKIWNICYIYIYTDNQYRCCVNVNSIRFLFTSQMWRAWVNRSQTGSPEMMCTSPRQSKELISIMRCGVIESPKVSMGKVSWVWVSFFRREKEIPTSPPNKLCLLKQHHLPRWHLLSSSFHLAVFRGPHSGRPQAVGRKPQYQSLRKVLSHYFKFGIYGTYMIRNIVIHPYNYCRINQVFCVCSYFT